MLIFQYPNSHTCLYSLRISVCRDTTDTSSSTVFIASELLRKTHFLLQSEQKSHSNKTNLYYDLSEHYKHSSTQGQIHLGLLVGLTQTILFRSRTRRLGQIRVTSFSLHNTQTRLRSVCWQWKYLGKELQKWVLILQESTCCGHQGF